jgi:two-component system, response regulator PdtaR
MKVLRVLVVEDEILIGMLLADALGAMGYDVCAIEATETGAVAAAARCKPDLMIVDARLGDGSGVSAVEEILRTGWIPHVFISGETATIQALRPDAIVIQKPFRDMDLNRAIQRVLDSASSP